MDTETVINMLGTIIVTALVIVSTINSKLKIFIENSE